MSKDTPPLGRCPVCGLNMDIVGKAHRCIAPGPITLPSGEELAAPSFPRQLPSSSGLAAIGRANTARIRAASKPTKGRTRGGKKVEVPDTPANREKLLQKERKRQIEHMVDPPRVSDDSRPLVVDRERIVKDVEATKRELRKEWGDDYDRNMEFAAEAILTPANRALIVKELDAEIEKVKVKKRGRPAKRTPEERKALRAELMRKKRAEAKG